MTKFQHRIRGISSTRLLGVAAVCPALIASIFLGNAHLGITFPVAIIPAVCLIALNGPLQFPLGACILGLLPLPLLLQSLSGLPLQDRSDLVLYLPFLYAVVCASAVRPIDRDRDLFIALMTGGVALSVLMLTSLAHRFLTDMPSSLSALKTAIDTPLGNGNYLAAFLVFLFNVALHRRSWLALLFAVMSLATFSRTGVVMLGVSALIFVIAIRLNYRLFLIALGDFFVAALGTCMIVYAAASSLTDFTELGSTGVRLMMWRDAIDAITYHPIIGASRSWYVRHLNFGYAWDFTLGAWNPHNFILASWMLFGVVGAVTFATFLFIAVKSVSEKARMSATWRGILAGLVIFIAWGLFEDLLLNASALILIATLYGLAREPRKSRKGAAVFVTASAAAALMIGVVNGPKIFKSALTTPAHITFQFADGWRHYDEALKHGGSQHWSDGEWSTIDIQFHDIPDSARYAVLTFDARGYLAHPFKYEQRVSVYLDDVTLASARIRTSDSMQFKVYIPMHLIANRKDLKLKFKAWTPIEAKELGVDADLGKLAFAVTEIDGEFL